MCGIEISIVLPVYNAEKYLDNTLQSICTQSFKDFELIAIDDGSKDSSLLILKQYRDKIDNLTIISNENSGVSKTRNKGINLAKGKYICFVDSDDILHQDYLKNLYKPVKLYEAELVYCGYCVFYDEINFGLSTNAISEKIEINNVDCFDYVMAQGLGTPLWNKLYQLELLKRNNIYFKETSSFGEDMFFNWKVFMAFNNIYYINESLYGYRQNVDGVTMKYHPNLYDCYKEEYNEVFKFGKNKGVDCEKLQMTIKKNLLKRFYSIFVMNVRRKDGLKKAYQYIQYVVNDALVVEAIELFQSLDIKLFNKTDIKILNFMKRKQYAKLLSFSYYLDVKFRLFRCTKNLLKKLFRNKLEVHNE